jgi:endoglucanase
MITYQRAIFLGMVLIFSISCQPSTRSSAQETGETSTEEKTFDIHQGVNISHWLSQSRARGEQRRNYFTEKDVMAVAEAGFDHIRIPIDEEQMWDEEGKKEAEAFDLLHQALGWMEMHNLKALVDLHIIRSHHFLDDDPPLFTDPAEQQKFANLWVQLSEELQKYPNENVAYELLNESVAKDHEDWNKVYRLAYDQVREREPERVIFIGPNRWQNVRYFPDLTVPENDPNIVLSFHFYIPHIITHYTASWTDIKDYEGPIHYPGVLIQPEDTLDLPEEVRAEVRRFAGSRMGIEQLEELMQIGIAKADGLGLQLYCGEFGCLNTIPTDMRNRWFSDVITLFERHDIAWSAWDLKSGGFGMFDPEDYSLMIPEEILFMEEE